MSTTGWSFNASHSYHVSRVDNAGHCIGECLENNTCNGVLYNTTNDICNHFDNCATEECLVPETPSAFSVNEPYLITCLQGTVQCICYLCCIFYCLYSDAFLQV